MKHKTVWCEGHWAEDKNHIYEVQIGLNSWDEEPDMYDDSIFYYMDGEPLEVGTDLDGFIITSVGEIE